MSMSKKAIQIKIDGSGSYTLEAKEGFSGESCLSKTKDIELILGGTEVDGGKTDSYYDGDDNPIGLTLDL